jgi:hypothetical protein
MSTEKLKKWAEQVRLPSGFPVRPVVPLLKSEQVSRPVALPVDRAKGKGCCGGGSGKGTPQRIR